MVYETIKVKQEGDISDNVRMQRHISEIAILIKRAPQPIIACVHGVASGGGSAMALASDVRLAGESARMNTAFLEKRPPRYSDA